MNRKLSTTVALLALSAGLGVRSANAALQSQTAVPLAEAASVLDQYCVTCHNQTANTGGLSLESTNVEDIESDPEAWEAVVRKLRTGMMPPKGAPRPERATLDGLAARLEAQLDEAAARNPDPGSPTLHRLNRTEYANAIRDLLDLEIDAELLLPADSTAGGFDNIADVLNTSPTLVQGYLSAAMKVSRLAVGDLTAPPTITTYQSEGGSSGQVEGLPLGTEGGMTVLHNFPLDAEYEFSAGGILTIDGVRAGADRTGAPAAVGQGGGRGGRGGRNVRIPVTAGPHLLAVSSMRSMDSRGAEGIFSAPGRGGGGASITVTGPFDTTGAGDTPSRRRIFICRPERAGPATLPGEEQDCALEILGGLATRAFRRPVDRDDPSLAILMRFFEAGRSEGTFETGIQHGLARLLIDPQFIFRLEHVPGDLPDGAVYPLTDLELASRLSFFLWSSIPDDELREVAARGTLSDPEILTAQTMRMIADPRAQALIDNFASQWMRLRDLEDAEPESDDFDSDLKVAFERETRLLFESIVREDRSIVDLLDSNYTFVDERLARHYGIPDVRGSRVRRVPLDASDPRRGILGHGSVLLITSVANRTSPVTRGQWVLENLLGAPPPSPPPGVETNLDEAPDVEAPRTLRERMEQHRTNPACASCHNIMDPIGFTLENFDLVGRWRENDGDTPIDASAEMVDGTRLSGPASLRQALLDRSDVFVTTAVEKLTTYAVGRSVEHTDMPAIRAIVRSAADENYRFSELVLGVVKSEPFRMRKKETRRESAVNALE
jgi:mono/diheme cytochrome c family protein